MLIELALAHNHYILPAAQGCVHVGADPDLFTASTCFGSVGAIGPVCGKKPEHLLILWGSVCRQWYSVPLADSAVMSSIPYWLGKKLGSQAAQHILARYPKAAYLHDLRSGNDFFFVLTVRLLGILPADVVSAYMGAVGMRYRDYLPACILGFLPSCVLFPIMGMNISDVRSPQFLISLSIELAAMLSSCVVFHVCRKKNCHAQRNQDEKHD